MNIYKYKLDPDSIKHTLLNEVLDIDMPIGSEILTAQVQKEDPVLWALVDPNAPVVKRRIYIVTTGQDKGVAEPGKYIATIQIMRGNIVIHLFDGGELLV